MNNSYDVVVVGAGMVGATIACGLAQSGLSLAIIDSHVGAQYVADSVPHIRVSALSFASEQVLRHVGAWHFIEQKRLCPYRRLAVHEQHPTTGLAAILPDISTWARTEFCAADIGKSHLGHIVENDLIQLSLHQTMARHENIQQYCPARITAMQLDDEIKLLTLDDGTVLESRLVIGADGAQSQLRQAADIGQFREQYEQHAMVCTVSYQGAQQDITWQMFTEHGPLAFLPLADSGDKHYASLVWYDTPSNIASLMALGADQLREHLQAAYPAQLPKLDAVHAKARFPLFKSHAHHYVRPGIALAGDAAHTINPLAGQGVNLGFMDAAVLIEILGQARLADQGYSSLEVLRNYEQQRRFENQSMMSLMDAFYYGFGSQHLPLRAARNVGLGIAQRAGFAKNKVMQYAIGARGALPRLAQPA